MNAVSYRTEIFCHVRAVLPQKHRILRKICCAKFLYEPSISLKCVKVSGILLDGWLFFHHFTSHLLLLSSFYIRIESRLPKRIFLVVNAVVMSCDEVVVGTIMQCQKWYAFAILRLNIWECFMIWTEAPVLQ